MKSFFTIATLALATALVGCNNNKQDAAAPGAVSGNECSGCSSAAAPGAVSAESCGSASSCSDAAAPGAVSSDDACGSGSGACPFSGQAG
jgi:uncharacterized lipoprotein NlpE involved in copper resistance